MRISLLLFPALVSAITYSSDFCITKYGASSVSALPTSNTTISKTYTATIKTTTTTTATAQPTTKTRTTLTKSTSTVYKTTNTFTSTEYETSTVYEQQYTTIYDTTTFTYTSYLSTTTAPTTPGFIPIQSYLQTAGYSPAERDVKPTTSQTLYPTKVSCTAKIQDITVSKSTVTATRTTTPTSTVFATSTIVVTVNRGTASTTITSTSTVPTTRTFTATQYVHYTSTETAVGPVGTAYAACEDKANYVQSIDGYYISGVAFPYYGQDSTNAPRNAYECCVASAAGGYSGWYHAYAQTCYLFIAQGCHPEYEFGDLVNDKYDTFHNSTAGNGNCGRYRYDAADDLRQFPH